jgi:uncharacterized protein (DUF697 family)
MSDKEMLANELVKKYSLYSAGAGLIPVPVLDWAAISGVQMKMLADLGALYGVPFEADRVKPIVSALIGGYASTKLGYGIGGGLIKSIPLIGQTIGMLAVPGFAYGLTYAVGKVFITHFASGGTFLDFDPDKVRAYFKGVKTGASAAA